MNLPEPVETGHAVVPVERLTANEIVARTRLVREVMEAVMKVNVHFGIIPGTRKPSLWQPGAEKLLMAFALAPDLEIEDLSTPQSIRYRIVCRVRHIPTGEIVGTGVGEASSDEEKYRWREAVCLEEWEETPEDRRRKKWKKKRNGNPFTVLQVRTEPADIANTVLKMAEKRAKVDAAKSTTAASDVFDQDLEDLADIGVDLNGGAPEEEVAKPKAKPANGGNGVKATPPEREPGSDDEPSEPVASGEAAGAWEAAHNGWHEKGAVSDAQTNRLFAIAHSNGWSSDDVVALVLEHLGCTVEELPWGTPYNTVVSIFETNKAVELPL